MGRVVAVGVLPANSPGSAARAVNMIADETGLHGVVFRFRTTTNSSPNRSNGSTPVKICRVLWGACPLMTTKCDYRRRRTIRHRTYELGYLAITKSPRLLHAHVTCGGKYPKIQPIVLVKL